VQKETKRWEVSKNKQIQKFFSLNTEEQDEEEGKQLESSYRDRLSLIRKSDKHTKK